MKQIKDGNNTDNRRKFNSKKTIHTANFIAAIAAVVTADHRICTKALASTHGVSAGTVFTILHKELGLVKKSARCVPKLLSQVLMERRVETWGGDLSPFIKMVQDKGRSILEKIITMDESVVSMHTPETKRSPGSGLKMAHQAPFKAKVVESRTKQMVLTFFDDKGMIYTNFVPRAPP